MIIICEFKSLGIGRNKRNVNRAQMQVQNTKQNTDGDVQTRRSTSTPSSLDSTRTKPRMAMAERHLPPHLTRSNEQQVEDGLWSR